MVNITIIHLFFTLIIVLNILMFPILIRKKYFLKLYLATKLSGMIKVSIGFHVMIDIFMEISIFNLEIINGFKCNHKIILDKMELTVSCYLKKETMLGSLVPHSPKDII